MSTRSEEVVPAPIRSLVQRAGGHEGRVGRVVISQRGEMRLEPDGRWLAFSATQWMATEETAFAWRARVRFGPLLTVAVEDAYEGGKGRLDARLWGLVPVARGRGPDVDQGEAQRYLAELAWNPIALRANPALRFEERPDGSVRVTCGRPETHVDLFFDGAGDVVRTYTETRPFGRRGPMPWEGVFSDHRDLGGLRVPTRGEVRWHLPEGPFPYWRGELTGLERPSVGERASAIHQAGSGR